MFYPGVVERNVNWLFSSREGFTSIKSAGLVDHVTLEKGFQRWHVTILEADGTKRPRLPSYRTKNVTDNVFYWFGLTIQDSFVLETTPEELVLVFGSPPRDTDRRVKEMIRSRKNAIFHLIRLNNISLSEKEFLHFDFIIGPSNLNVDTLQCRVPTQKPIVYDYDQAFKEETHLRAHGVSLEGIKEQIWVVVSKHIGKVSDKAIFTCL